MPLTARSVRRSAPLAMFAAVLFVLAGCTSVTPIRKLLDDPSHYNGKTVKIKGNVEESAGGLGVGAYQVKDNTGTLPVVAEQSGAPRTGATVEVKGTFQSLFTLGSKTLAVLKEQSRKLIE